MIEKWQRNQRGRFKGKRIEWANSTDVDMFGEISADFMQQVFDLMPGEYLITDESSLRDFTDFETSVEELQTKVFTFYEIDISDFPTGNLLEIFKRIHRKYK